MYRSRRCNWKGYGAPLAQINGKYGYDQSSAAGVTIYMLDMVGLSYLTAKSLADD